MEFDSSDSDSPATSPSRGKRVMLGVSVEARNALIEAITKHPDILCPAGRSRDQKGYANAWDQVVEQMHPYFEGAAGLFIFAS